MATFRSTPQPCLSGDDCRHCFDRMGYGYDWCYYNGEMSKFLPLIWNSICFYFILITRFGCESNFRDGLHKDRSLCVWPIYYFFLLPLPVCYHKHCTFSVSLVLMWWRGGGWENDRWHLIISSPALRKRCVCHWGCFLDVTSEPLKSDKFVGNGTDGECGR